MAWCRQATSHYLSQCWPRSLSPYDVIRPQWVKKKQWADFRSPWVLFPECQKKIFMHLVCYVMLDFKKQMIAETYGIWYWPFNWLWPNDTIWQHRSGSTLAQVMACGLTAPSHYLNQYWLPISKVMWHSTESNLTVHSLAIILYSDFEIDIVMLYVNITFCWTWYLKNKLPFRKKCFVYTTASVRNSSR